MMVADMNLQVWLGTVPDAPPGLIATYVQSPEEGDLQYRLNVIKQGRSGSSTISQGGAVHVQANAPTALTRFSLSVGENDSCRIELILLADGVTSGVYKFDCPRTPSR